MEQNSETFGRRNFLQIVAAAGALGAASKLGWRISQKPAAVERSRVMMGTVVNLTVIGGDRAQARHALKTCFTTMKTLESLFSRFQPESQLSRLNRDGELRHPAPAMVDVIHQSQKISRQTGGKFDISIKPVVDLYQKHRALDQTLPPRSAIQEALDRVNYRDVMVDNDILRFSQPEMSITLDGIAKGYIVDRGVGTLRRLGYGNVLVEAGGDLATLGYNPRETSWQIGVRSPREGEENILTRVNVRDQGLATSGDYLQYFSNDLRHHHVMNPQQGISSSELASVSILAPSAMLADGYATAVMVMGVEKGKRWIESLPGTEALLVTKEMQCIETRGFSRTADHHG